MVSPILIGGVFIEGQASLLVPAKDSNALAGVLVELLSNSEMLHECK
jgi:hypothetical protein